MARRVDLPVEIALVDARVAEAENYCFATDQ
jgi:hypothetical protein